MAALKRSDDKRVASEGARVRTHAVKPSTRIYEFAADAFKRTGGPTPALRRVYAAYVQSQKKLAADH